MNDFLKKLVAVADRLDRKGALALAQKIDSVLEKIALPEISTQSLDAASQQDLMNKAFSMLPRSTKGLFVARSNSQEAIAFGFTGAKQVEQYLLSGKVKREIVTKELQDFARLLGATTIDDKAEILLDTIVAKGGLPAVARSGVVMYGAPTDKQFWSKII